MRSNPETPQSYPSEVSELLETVVKGDYCSGCGACATVENSGIEMTVDEFGRFQPSLNLEIDNPNLDVKVLSVCPFSGQTPNEDDIGKLLFGDNCSHHELIGYHASTYAGYVAEGDFRDRGSSGGMGTWILNELFERDLIDAVIHVKQHESKANNSILFGFQTSDSIEEIRAGAKSRYYPVEMSKVLKTIEQKPGRYAIIGVPCFIKAIRLLAKQNSVIDERIHFCIGLVCGHLKTTKFADMFAWQCGIEPGNLNSIDFRKKMSQQNANKYGVEVQGTRENKKISEIRSNYEFFGYLWGQGFFKYPACDYCDDVLAETADVTVGDAWLPQYVKDSSGTNVVIVRNSLIQKLIEEGIASERLRLEPISADDAAKSQDAGLRHRREGLAYRLYLKDKAKLWRPEKRVQAQANHLNRRLKKIHQLRIIMARKSHTAFREAVKVKNFAAFKTAMEPTIEAYDRLYEPSWKQKLKQRLKKLLNYKNKT